MAWLISPTRSYAKGVAKGFQVTVIDLWRLLRHSFWWLVVSAVLGVALAAGFSATRQEVFQASSTGYVVTGSSGSVSDAYSGQSLAGSKVQQYLPLADTRAVADRISDYLVQSNPDVKAAPISASVIPGSSIMVVTAKGPTPESAQAVANAGVRAMADEIRRLETLNPLDAADDARVDDVPTTGNSTIALIPFEPAELPTHPISPDWTKNLILGAVAGLLVGLLVAALRRSLDSRVRTVDEAEALAGVSVLGIIPQTPELAKQRQPGQENVELGMASEALRKLRTNLRFVSVDSPPRSIVITSPNPAEGKSTVAANLARVLAESGQPTVLVDADLRRPMQHKVFGADGGVGLTSVLSGDVALSDALQQTDTPLLELLSAGRIPPNPSELVGSEHMANLIKSLSETHLVIIDAPPLLPVTDGGLLTIASDGAIVVLRAGKTYKEQVKLGTQTLQRLGGNVFGLVLNGVSRTKMSEALYGYGRYYGRSKYYYEDRKSVTRKGGRRKQQTENTSIEAERTPATVSAPYVPTRLAEATSPAAHPVSPL